jgi:hypothetical protein
MVVFGFRPYADFEKALLRLLPEAQKHAYEPTLDALLKKYNSLSAKEYAVLAGISVEEAIAALRARLDLQEIATKNGSVWRKF